ncbi:hypothetical protein J2T14_004617 [Paenibacillus harenae]|nr:hypothetical protein [Paenibacillus harenae]
MARMVVVAVLEEAELLVLPDLLDPSDLLGLLDPQGLSALPA